MTNKRSADEHSKDEIAKKVITAKQKYFFPESGRQITASNITEANEILNADSGTSDNEPPRKDGDGN